MIGQQKNNRTLSAKLGFNTKKKKKNNSKQNS